jgi:hypothetical protein
MADSKKSKAAQKAAATRKANAQARLVVLPVRFFLSDLDVVHMAAKDKDTNAGNFVRQATLKAVRALGYTLADLQVEYPRTAPHGGQRAK